MISRYTRPEMGRIWTEQNKFQQWLEVELAASEALASLGVVPADAARLLRQHAGFDVARILEIEKEVKHDVIAFTTAVAERMAGAGHAEASRWLHYGLTSNDVVDTAQALQLRQASAIILRELEGLRAVLKRRAVEFQHAVQIGRTHGVHAEPITFGLKLAIWYEEAGRNLTRVGAALIVDMDRRHHHQRIGHLHPDGEGGAGSLCMPRNNSDSTRWRQASGGKSSNCFSATSPRSPRRSIVNMLTPLPPPLRGAQSNSFQTYYFLQAICPINLCELPQLPHIPDRQVLRRSTHSPEDSAI